MSTAMLAATRSKLAPEMPTATYYSAASETMCGFATFLPQQSKCITSYLK